MSYVLFNLITSRKMEAYDDLEGARRGMRCANRNAGWARLSRAEHGKVELEWCLPATQAEGNTTQMQCGYGPYAISPARSFEANRKAINVKVRRMVGAEMPDGEQVEKVAKKEAPRRTAAKKATPAARRATVRRRGRTQERPAAAKVEHSTVHAAARVEKESKRFYPRIERATRKASKEGRPK